MFVIGLRCNFISGMGRMLPTEHSSRPVLGEAGSSFKRQTCLLIQISATHLFYSWWSGMLLQHILHWFLNKQVNRCHACVLPLLMAPIGGSLSSPGETSEWPKSSPPFNIFNLDLEHISTHIAHINITHIYKSHITQIATIWRPQSPWTSIHPAPNRSCFTTGGWALDIRSSVPLMVEGWLICWICCPMFSENVARSGVPTYF